MMTTERAEEIAGDLELLGNKATVNTTDAGLCVLASLLIRQLLERLAARPAPHVPASRLAAKLPPITDARKQRIVAGTHWIIAKQDGDEVSVCGLPPERCAGIAETEADVTGCTPCMKAVGRKDELIQEHGATLAIRTVKVRCRHPKDKRRIEDGQPWCGACDKPISPRGRKRRATAAAPGLPLKIPGTHYGIEVDGVLMTGCERRAEDVERIARHADEIFGCDVCKDIADVMEPQS